jgi:hypothetical protein
METKMTIRAHEALLAWTPLDCTWKAGTAGQVKVGPLIASAHHRDWTDPYLNTGGAAYVHRRSLRGKAALAEVLADFVLLTAVEGLDPVAVHNAFLEIEEYRAAVPKYIRAWVAAGGRAALK